MKMRAWLWGGVMLVLVWPVAAQEASGRTLRELSLQMSRYELMLGKLQEQNQQLMSQVRTLQRALDQTNGKSQAQSEVVKGMLDRMQGFENSTLRNMLAAQSQLTDKVNTLLKPGEGPWGSNQRDCAELGVKHQEIKVTVKPDGSRGTRALCFDGKVLHLGTEIYTVGDK